MTETHKYDLAAMEFVPKAARAALDVDRRNLGNAFYWIATPQGSSFWHHQYLHGLTEEGRAAIAEMLEQHQRA